MSYTTSLAVAGKGVTIGIGATPTIIGEVKTIKFSGRKMDTDDVTNLQSPMKEFISTLADPGEVALEGNRVPGDAGQLALETAFAAGTTTSFTVQLPKTTGQVTSGDKYVFNAIVSENGDWNFETMKADSFSTKLKISGLIVFTAGA